MTTQVTASVAKAQLLGLLDRVSSGDDVEITKHGRVVARLVPARGPHALRGRLSGSAMTVEEDDAALFSTGEGWETQ